MKTSPPELSRSHSWQFSVRMSIVMHVVPAACGANSTTLEPFCSADSHDCASGARDPAGTLWSSSYGDRHSPPRRSETPQCRSSGWPCAAPPARQLIRTDGGHDAITSTSHVPVLEPLSVVRGIVCVATTGPPAPVPAESIIAAAAAFGAAAAGAGTGGGGGGGGGAYDPSVAALLDADSQPPPPPPPPPPGVNAGVNAAGGSATEVAVAVAVIAAAAAFTGVAPRGAMKFRNGLFGSERNRS